MAEDVDVATHEVLDYDVGGTVRIRVTGGTEADVALMTRLFGTPSAAAGEADLTVRFSPAVEVVGLRYLGLNSAAFTDEDFYLLGPKSGRIDARIPFATLGHPCEIECRSGLGFVPHLFDAITLACMRKGFVALHGSAFVHDGAGVLVLGWEKGGKTETLLAFANHGAYYVGDEIVMLAGDGRTMFGIPVPISIWDWNFDQIPALLPPLHPSQRLLLGVVRGLVAVREAHHRGRRSRTMVTRALDALIEPLREKLRIWALPARLFEGRIWPGRAPVDTVVLSVSDGGPGVSVETCDPAEVAERMRSSNECERMTLLRNYRAFRFAFPRRHNDLLDALDERQGALLRSALAGKDAYVVRHPYPVPFEAMYEKLSPLIRQSGARETSMRLPAGAEF